MWGAVGTDPYRYLIYHVPSVPRIHPPCARPFHFVNINVHRTRVLELNRPSQCNLNLIVYIFAKSIAYWALRSRNFITGNSFSSLYSTNYFISGWSALHQAAWTYKYWNKPPIVPVGLSRNYSLYLLDSAYRLRYRTHLFTNSIVTSASCSTTEDQNRYTKLRKR